MYLNQASELRFLKYVETSGDHWIWLGGRMKGTNGLYYGGFSPTGSRSERAHIVAYRHWNGPISPAAPVVRHVCHISMCVKPEHLILGTQGDNMNDMREAGRQTRGENVFSAKLTETEVLRIYASTEPNQMLADLYGVNFSTINGIRRGHSWGWLTNGQPHGDIPDVRNIGKRKLSPAQYDEIRALYATGVYTQRQLGERFGMSQGGIRCVIIKKYGV